MTMTETTQDARRDAILAGIAEAREDFRKAAADGYWQRTTGLHLPADGALRNAWLAAYAGTFARLAAPGMTENHLIADGRTPRFYAGQRIEFTRFDLLALKRPEWQAGEVVRYFEPEWQPVYGGRTLRFTVRVIGKRDRPVGKEIDVSEFQVRLPQDTTVTA